MGAMIPPRVRLLQRVTIGFALLAVLAFLGAAPTFATGEQLTLTPPISEVRLAPLPAEQFIATLTDSAGQPLAGKTVTFSIAGRAGYGCGGASNLPTDALGRTAVIVQAVWGGPCGSGHLLQGLYDVTATFVNDQRTTIASNTAHGAFYEDRPIGPAGFQLDNFPGSHQGRIVFQAPAAANIMANFLHEDGTMTPLTRVFCGGSSGCLNGFVETGGYGTFRVELYYVNVLGQRISTIVTTTLPPMDPVSPDPNAGATPELDTIVLFVSGLSGIVGYGALGLRRSRLPH